MSVDRAATAFLFESVKPLLHRHLAREGEAMRTLRGAERPVRGAVLSRKLAGQRKG